MDDIPIRMLGLAVALYLGMSFVSLLAYASDKRRAAGGRRRIPERTLLTIDLLFGWPGGLIAQHLVRHKNRKLSYQVRFWLIVLVHGAAWAGIAYWWLRSRGEAP